MAIPEIIGVESLNLLISKTDRLEPYIKKQDKYPIWDGEILVYKDKSHSKKDLQRVPVQVKAITCNDFSKNKISYSVNETDLNSYYKEGGAVYFVIYKNDNNDTKIYYSKLLPYNIRAYKLSKKIQLEEFPEDIKEIEEIFDNFLLHRQKQLIFIDNGFKDINTDGFINEISFQTNKEPLEYLLSQENLLIYKKSKDGYIIDCKDGLIIQQISNKKEFPIYINDKKFYDNIEIVKEKNENYFKIGKCFSIIFNNETKEKNTFNYLLKGTLKERIKDLEFFLEILKHKHIQIGGKENILNFSEQNLVNIDILEIQNYKNYLLCLKTTFENIGYFGDLDIDNMNEKDEENISILIYAFFYNKPIKLKNTEKPISFVLSDLLNINLLFFAIKNKQEEYNCFNFFKEKFEIKAENKEFSIKTSQFLQLNKDMFLKASNIDYDFIYNDIISIEPTPEYLNMLNEWIIKSLLPAYDEMKNKNSNILDLSLKIMEWIITKNKNIYTLINKLQIIKRQRLLNKEELLEIENILKNSENEMIKCACRILLENKNLTEIYLNKMADDEKKVFINFPICNLIKNK